MYIFTKTINEFNSTDVNRSSMFYWFYLECIFNKDIPIFILNETIFNLRFLQNLWLILEMNDVFHSQVVLKFMKTSSYCSHAISSASFIQCKRTLQIITILLVSSSFNKQYYFIKVF